MPDDKEDLREALRQRIGWFYETQLRELNYEKFKGVEPDQPGPFLDLISEQAYTVTFPGRFGRLKELPRVYLDSQQPVWTAQQRGYHDAFAAMLLSRIGHWLDHREPRRLGERLRKLEREYAASRFQSITDPMPMLGRFPRKHLDDGKAQAISRAELAAAKPWLIPELYRREGSDPTRVEQWVANLEQYVADFEAELTLTVGGIAGTPIPFDVAAPATYRTFLSLMLTAASTRPAGEAVKVQLVALRKNNPEDKEATHHYDPMLTTNGAAKIRPADFSLSSRVGYWAKVVELSLKECVALKPNSDMGLCLLVRMLYRYGTLPDALGAGEDLTWRRRQSPGDTYTTFMAERDKAIGTNEELRGKFRACETKLRIILEETALHPRGPDPSFSPLVGEILKQGLLSYKYWIDEHPRALGNDRLNKVKKGLVGEGEDIEMEFWSENHYIMFASSEYLLGQLWADEAFQPCRAFADSGDTTGRRTGDERRARGRARVLKWLNNRLMFGWTEFNSSGYYREHLWALLNLVDFSLDEEVRTKATMAVDLMLFDVVRFLHRGAMGAAGGRSQFKSKSSGFDNGLADVVELMLGVKGLYSEGDAQIAASFASSTYTTPLALLEIGARPPTYPFTDRSRVSITFDEAPKYGITWSQDSDLKRSLLQGYAVKRARYSPHLGQVNREIARTHDDYDARDDDIVFFWGMSAFVNKQIVQGTLRLREKYGLEKSDAFKSPKMLIDLGSLFKSPGSVLDIPGDVLDSFTGAPDDTLDEETADDLSVLIEGSTRSRANIVTYRSPGAMLSSLQNFRYGQLNFQSSVQQATLNGAFNVFVNAGFGGIDISDLAAFAAGTLVGGTVGGLFGPAGVAVGAVGGGVGAVIANNAALQDTNPLNPGHDDGPDWWTGNWALPRVLQHGGAVMMLSEFYDIQDFLAETGSHVWFPKAGFDRVVERRTSAYDDANFALLDIGHIGPKGFWLFGKVVHALPEGASGEPEEGYVGVFSNKRPEWLTMESDPYDHYVEERREKDAEDDGGKNRERLNGLPDLFADKDWYVNGKNIWIVQVGSRSEFGSFEAFMDRVASARVHVDDTGDLECTYDVPQPDGGSARLRLTNGDEPEFEVNGKPLATDLFPRFENPFVRGGFVEWQQRAYCLEWNGHSLLHDFSDSGYPLRVERPLTKPGDAETIRALVIHLHTREVEMEAYTIATATVEIGCEQATRDQVVAVGPVGEGAEHDAEWIYFDRPLRRSPDMTLAITHPTSGGERADLSFLDPDAIADLEPGALLGPLSLLGAVGDPEWKATFTLRALMQDHRVLDCAVTFTGLDFEDDRRSTGRRAFAVRLAEWADWQPVGGALEARAWLLAAHPPSDSVWHDHHDLFLVDRTGRAWHRRMSCAGAVGFWSELDAAGATPLWTSGFSWAAVTDPAGQPVVFVVNEGRFLARVGSTSGVWHQPWLDLAPLTRGPLFPKPVPLGPASTVTAVPGGGPFDGTADLYLTGADGDVYRRRGWVPGDGELWDQVETAEFDFAAATPVGIAGRQVVARSQQGTLWVRDPEQIVLGGGGWREVAGPGFVVTKLAVSGTDDLVRFAVRGPAGQVSVGEQVAGGPVDWRPIAAEDGWAPARTTDLAWAEPDLGSAWVFAAGLDGSVRGALAREGIWRPVGSGTAPKASSPSRLAATSRTLGQLELFTEAEGHSLQWTWWS